jgi:hypothetical protein
MPGAIALLTTAIMSTTAFGTHPGPLPVTERYVAVLEGAHESPEVLTTAGGVASFTILGDTAIRYDLKVARLRDPWSAGLYSSGPGRDGFKSVTLYVGIKTGEVNGVIAGGLITNRDTLAGMTVKEVIQLLRTGQAYVEIRTARHPSGELRGSVVPAPDWEKRVAMEGRDRGLIY